MKEAVISLNPIEPRFSYWGSISLDGTHLEFTAQYEKKLPTLEKLNFEDPTGKILSYRLGVSFFRPPNEEPLEISDNNVATFLFSLISTVILHCYTNSLIGAGEFKIPVPDFALDISKIELEN